MKRLPQGALAWALYDWANTGYAMIGLALIFPRLYKTYWGSGLSDADQTAWFTGTVGVASFCVFVLAPILGSVAELGGIRKKLLLRFATVGMVACAGMYLIGEGNYRLATLVYIVGTVCFYSGNIFFDSMLERVSTVENRHTISGLGFSFGYAAGFLILGLIYAVTTFHEKLGFADVKDSMRFLFVLAAAWWAVFTVPLVLRFHEEPKHNPHSVLKTAGLGLREAWTTLKDIIRNRNILWFLIAYQCYIDGVNTIITTAANYGSTIGFSQTQIFIAFFCVQVAGVPCALLFGYLGQRIGPRKMIFVAILVYLGVSFYGAFITTEPVHLFGKAFSQMYVLAVMIGMCQGGIQALSRSYFLSIVPPDKTVAYFGFYSMIGKSAAILGPALMALSAVLFNNPEHPTLSTRIGMGMISVLFLLGAGFLAVTGRKKYGPARA
ncbi:MAG: MFS transporter [Verrucomicrobiota bacterium JB024]|nr:MFS transporter [Verrucomicrobiota bacterium JB024]